MGGSFNMPLTRSVTTTDGSKVGLVDLLIAFESGTLGEADTVFFFAGLVKYGLAWTLQGSYGRAAMRMIECDLITPDGDLTAYAQEILGVE